MLGTFFSSPCLFVFFFFVVVLFCFFFLFFVFLFCFCFGFCFIYFFFLNFYWLTVDFVISVLQKYSALPNH